MRKEEERERERDVLVDMVVTLDVSHFERSPLNTEGPRNAIKRSKVREKKESRELFVNKRFIINIRYR